MRVLVMLLTILLVLAVQPLIATADDTQECLDGCVAAKPGDGVIDVKYTRGVSEKVPGRGTGSNGAAPGRTTWITVEEEMAPTCYTNTRGGDMALCGAAVSTCPDGLIRFWVWHQVTTFTRAADGTVTSEVTRPWYQEEGTYCLGADDPGVPTIARVIDQVRSDFTSLPLRPPAPRSDPAPTTLVNVATAFSAGSAEPQVFTPTLLGTTVTVTAKPVLWTWTWGDGTRDEYTRPGTPQEPDVTHTYTKAADMTVRVVVTWRGTFRVGNDPTEYEITTPAFSRTGPMTVRVRQARSQLVR